MPRGRRSQTTPRTAPASNPEIVSEVQVPDKESQSIETPEPTPSEPVIQVEEAAIHTETASESKSNSHTSPIIIHEEKSPPQHNKSVANMADTNVKNTIETVLCNGDKDYNEEKEFHRTPKVVSL